MADLEPARIADTGRDIVAYCNGLSKTEFWSLGMGDVQNLLDEALEEIERLRDMNVELLGALRGLMNAWTSPKPDPTARPRAEEVLRQYDGSRRLSWDAPAPPLEGGDWGLAEDLDDGGMSEPSDLGDGAER